MLTALIVFACVFGAALLGMFLRAILPAHHLSDDTKSTVSVAMGLVATMAALILGLLVASAKELYDAEKSGVTQLAAKVVGLDRLLANYGPETQDARSSLRTMVERSISEMWPSDDGKSAQLDPSAASAEAVFASIEALKPQGDSQQALKAQALTTAIDIGQSRWLEFEQASAANSPVLMAILTFWLAVPFISFGLFSPRPNATILVALMLAAFSVAGAIFLILELEMPFDGILRISDAPMVNALSHLGQ
ncbi:MAG: hypothetical protein C0485_16170 [Pirellula sp.]|nr:hypothetical protein [Pirellula sp.]